MPGFKGRAIQLTWKGQQVAGVREKGLTLNGEAVDVTSDEDGGWRTTLDESAENSIDLSLSGVTKSSKLKQDWLTNQKSGVVVLTYPDGSILSFNAFMGNFTETGAYNDATTFELTLNSNGQPTYTPAP